MKKRTIPRVSIRKMVEPDFETLDPKLDHAAWGDPMTRYGAKLPDTKSPSEFGKELTMMVKNEAEANLSPFYQHLISGQLPISGLQEWCRQHYFDIRCFTTTIAQIVANANYQYDIRHVFALNLIEELGDIYPIKEHPVLFLKFCRALKLKDEEMEFVRPIPEMLISTEYRLKLVRDVDVISSVAAGSWVLEALVPERYRKIAKSLKENYGISDDDLEFFYAHTGGGSSENDYGGDWAHAGEALNFVKKYATTAESQERVRHAVWRSLEARKVCHLGLYRHIILKNDPRYQAILAEAGKPKKKTA